MVPRCALPVWPAVGLTHADVLAIVLWLQAANESERLDRFVLGVDAKVMANGAAAVVQCTVRVCHLCNLYRLVDRFHHRKRGVNPELKADVVHHAAQGTPFMAVMLRHLE